MVDRLVWLLVGAVIVIVIVIAAIIDLLLHSYERRLKRRYEEYEFKEVDSDD